MVFVPLSTGTCDMAYDQHKTLQNIWAVLLIAMGLLLCLKTPYAIRQGDGTGFLNFARYFIGVFLIVGGARKFYALYLAGSKEHPPEN